MGAPLSPAGLRAAFEDDGRVSRDIACGLARSLRTILLMATRLSADAAEIAVLPAIDGLAAVTVACAPDMSKADANDQWVQLLRWATVHKAWPAATGYQEPPFYRQWCQGYVLARLEAILDAIKNGVEEDLPEKDYHMLLVVSALALGSHRGRTTGLHVLRRAVQGSLAPVNGAGESFPFAPWVKPSTSLPPGEKFTCVLAIPATAFVTRWYVVHVTARDDEHL